MGVVSRLKSRRGERSGGAESGAAVAPAALLAVLFGLFLAFAGTWPAGNGPGAPGRILALDVPQWLAGALVIAACAASLSILVSLVPARRRKDPDEFTMEPPPLPEGGRIAMLALLALLAIGAALAAWLLSEMVRHGSPVTVGAAHSGLAASPSAPLPSERQRIGLPAANLVLDVVLAAVAFAAFAFALVMLANKSWDFLGFGRRRRHPRLAGAIAEALDAGAADLADDSDPRRAVIACYRRCESAIATVEHRRYPWQTPREYVQAALRALHLPAGAVASLLEIFERARFSELPIMARHRDAALAALGAIRAALEERSAHGTRR